MGNASSSSVASESNCVGGDTSVGASSSISNNDPRLLRENLLDKLASMNGIVEKSSSSNNGSSAHTTDATTCAIVGSRRNGTKKEINGTDIAASLAMTLLELGITLTASYFMGKLLAKFVAQNNNRPPGDATDEFMADNGTQSGGGGVIVRLKKLLVARHTATLKAMMEELEDHQLQWKQEMEEKKNDDIDDEEIMDKIQTQRQYEQLQIELQNQHDQSISTLSTLSPYEMNIAQGNVIDPTNIAVTFSDVGGMDDIKSEVYDLVVLPLLRPDLFMSDSGLVSPPKGILLYGPPGTGKTMLAKAIAKESHATFVNVQLSTIMNKWFGESNKLISATFQIARKLAPSVVFIDEIDAFLSQRDNTEGAAVSSMKSEFLTLWDGLLSERKGRATNSSSSELDEVDTPPLLPSPPIIVLGATNRPYDVDAAILRRLPRSFEVPLPNLQSRLQLLRLFLKNQSMTKSAKDYLPVLAKKTEGYSGSDLKEVCRAAAWEPVREMTTGASKQATGCEDTQSTTKSVLKRTSSGFPRRGTKARPVSEHDFLLAIQKVKKTGDSARQFHAKEFVRGREERASFAATVNGNSNGKGRVTNNSMANVDVQKLMAMAMSAAASMNSVDEGSHIGEEEEDGDDIPNV